MMSVLGVGKRRRGLSILDRLFSHSLSRTQKIVRSAILVVFALVLVFHFSSYETAQNNLHDSINGTISSSVVGGNEAPIGTIESLQKTLKPETDAIIAKPYTTINPLPPKNKPKKPKFVFYRGIGNDLPPRHALGQTLTNIKFVLDNEKTFPEVENRWLINRIVDPEQERLIIELLKSRNQTFLHVPIDIKEYAKRKMHFENMGIPDLLRSKEYRQASLKRKYEYTDYMLEQKNLYIMNNNGARNLMIEDGIKSGATWILPFDGNCFMTPMAWDEIRMAVDQNLDDSKYFVVPMARLQSNEDLANPLFRPEAREEPQIIFRFDAKERFSEAMRYGRRPKVELLWRLGVPGPWKKWPQSVGPWEKKNWTLSDDLPVSGQIPTAGWIARMFSGQSNLEQPGALVDRGISRSRGVEKLLMRVDAMVAEKMYGYSGDNLQMWNETVLAREKTAYQAKENVHLTALIDGHLLECANNSLLHGPFSVVHKLKMPPSNDKHDYYTPSPYYWPQKNKPKAPYRRWDGQRVPGTNLYDDQSENYDRSRLASLFGNTTCLSLAWYFTDDMRYAKHAAENIRTWFINPETRMNPSMRFAQIRWGHDNNVGANYGIIETKDLYFLLDAIRILYRAKTLTQDDMDELRRWFSDFITYLTTSKQGADEYYTANNHGVYYDIQVAAIASFLNDMETYFNHTERAKGRILHQFNDDGSLPEEMKRQTQLHYMMFGLQGWYTLARLSQGAGVDLWGYHKKDDTSPSLYRGAKFTIPQFNALWEHPESLLVDMERMYPMYYMALEHYPDLRNETPSDEYEIPESLYKAQPEFNPHDGIMPYWNLGLTLVELNQNQKS